MRSSLLLAAALLWPISSIAADFGTRGGAGPGNIDGIMKVLKQDPYDLELLISFGTSRGGSAERRWGIRKHDDYAGRQASPTDATRSARPAVVV